MRTLPLRLFGNTWERAITWELWTGTICLGSRQSFLEIDETTEYIQKQQGETESGLWSSNIQILVQVLILCQLLAKISSMNWDTQIVMSNKSDATCAFHSINSDNKKRARATHAFLENHVLDVNRQPKQVSSSREYTCKLNLEYQKPKKGLRALSVPITFTSFQWRDSKNNFSYSMHHTIYLRYTLVYRRSYDCGQAMVGLKLEKRRGSIRYFSETSLEKVTSGWTDLSLSTMELLPNRTNLLKMGLQSIFFHRPLQTLKQLSCTSLNINNQFYVNKKLN